MKRRNYVSPCFECLMLWNGEIRTSDVLDMSFENELSWRDIVTNPTPSDNNNIIF